MTTLSPINTTQPQATAPVATNNNTPPAPKQVPVTTTATSSATSLSDLVTFVRAQIAAQVGAVNADTIVDSEGNINYTLLSQILAQQDQVGANQNNTPLINITA